jgi:nicotinic acetylcholine receptor, invertebrate
VLERPVVNESDPLQLSFGLTLMQIIDVVRYFSITTFHF